MIPFALLQAGQLGRRVIGSGAPPPAANRVALLHCNGTNGSQTYTDVTGKTWTDEGAGGGASEISTAQSVFSGASLSLESGGYIRGPTSSDWAFGTGAFEIKYRVRFKAFDQSGATPNTMVSNYTSGTGLTIQYYTDGTPRLTLGNGDSYMVIANTTLSLDTWYAICVARSGSTSKIFLNGTEIGSATDTSDYDDTTPMMFGRLRTTDLLHYCNIYMDEIQILKGGTVTSANYTVETSEFTD